MLKVKCNGQSLPPTLKVEEAAALAGCGISAAYAACREGRWPALRITERRIVICTVPFLRTLGLEIDHVQTDEATTESHERSFPIIGKQENEGGGLRQE